MDDKKLKAAVLAELNWEPSVNAAHIGVAAASGIVTLTGHVQTFAEKHAAEASVLRVKGVKGVAQEMEVRLSFETKRGDEEIAAAAVDRLSWDTAVPRDAVKVRVDKGWITLDGKVDWHYQKEAAEHDVRNLVGVVGVTNKTEIKPRVSTTNVSDDIGHALHRSWFFDPAIAVSAEGGAIRLSGTVHSPHERQVAASTAWAAPGATSVENDIIVV